jgi:hypothetical protein
MMTTIKCDNKKKESKKASGQEKEKKDNVAKEKRERKKEKENGNITKKRKKKKMGYVPVLLDNGRLSCSYKMTARRLHWQYSFCEQGIS